LYKVLKDKIILISFFLGIVDRRSMNIVAHLIYFNDIFLMYFFCYKIILNIFWWFKVLERLRSILDIFLIEVVILNFLICSGIIRIERSNHNCLLIFSFDIDGLQVRIVWLIFACDFRDEAVLVRKALFDLSEKIISDLRGLTSLLRERKSTIYKI